VKISPAWDFENPKEYSDWDLDNYFNKGSSDNSNSSE